MAGPIQKALSDVVTTTAAFAAAGKKLTEDEKQAEEKKIKEAKAAADYERAVQKEAQASVLEADLVNLGADPESAHAYMAARELGLDTKKFGFIRKKGKFVGTYSSLAERLSKDSLADSLSSRLMSEKGFADRVMALGGTRKMRVRELVEASKGGKE